MKTRTVKSMIAALTLLASATTTAFALETSGTTGYSQSVQSYLQQIIPQTDASKLVGTSAVIKVSYGQNGQFSQAAISGAGDISFARMLHNNVNWKAFPANGKAETTIIVAVNKTGKLDINVQ